MLRSSSLRVRSPPRHEQREGDSERSDDHEVENEGENAAVESEAEERDVAEPEEEQDNSGSGSFEESDGEADD